MELSKKQMQQVVDWINEKIPGGWKCNLCGERKGWRINPTPVEVREHDENVIFSSDSKLIAIVVLTCANCGHMNLMDVETIGIKILAPKSE